MEMTLLKMERRYNSEMQCRHCKEWSASTVTCNSCYGRTFCFKCCKLVYGGDGDPCCRLENINNKWQWTMRCRKCPKKYIYWHKDREFDVGDYEVKNVCWICGKYKNIINIRTSECPTCYYRDKDISYDIVAKFLDFY